MVSKGIALVAIPLTAIVILLLMGRGALGIPIAEENHRCFRIESQDGSHRGTFHPFRGFPSGHKLAARMACDSTFSVGDPIPVNGRFELYTIELRIVIFQYFTYFTLF